MRWRHSLRSRTVRGLPIVEKTFFIFFWLRSVASSWNFLTLTYPVFTLEMKAQSSSSFTGRELMNFSGNRALSDTRNLRSGILFLALIPACLLASGAHAQLTYIDRYATGTVDDLSHSDGSQGTRFSALRGGQAASWHHVRAWAFCQIPKGAP
jgi:hypothetical protein